MDDVLRETETLDDAAEFVQSICSHEPSIRQRVLRARYFEFLNPGRRELPFDQVVRNMDDWAVPFRINRWVDGIHLSYDCSDAPQNMLLGAEQMQVSVDANWSIDGVQLFTSGVASDFRVAAFRQRVIPAGCGYIADCVADKLILCQPWRTDELAPLLDESIQQVEGLVQTAGNDAKAFLRRASELLRDLRQSSRWTQSS